MYDRLPHRKDYSWRLVDMRYFAEEQMHELTGVSCMGDILCQLLHILCMGWSSSISAADAGNPRMLPQKS